MKRVLVAILGSAWTVAACAGLLGIEELPVRSDVRDTGPPPDTFVPDTGVDACNESPAAGCACKHDFCDDFDLDAALGDKWRSQLTPGGGAFYHGRTEGGVYVGLGPEAISPPNTFETKLFSDDGDTYAFLFNKLSHQRGPSFQGVRYQFLSRVKEIKPTEDTGPIQGGAVVLGGMLTETVPPGGVVLAVAPGGVYLSAAGNDIFTSRDAAVATIYDGNIESLGKLAVTVNLYIVTRQRALLEGFGDACKDVTSDTVAAARVGGLTAACMALPPAIADIRWTAEGVVGLGGGMFGQGTAHVLHDNAMVDYFE